MSKLQNFNLKKFNLKSFIQEVLMACKFANLSNKERLALEEAIERMLTERIIATIISSFGDKDVEMYEKLFLENSNIDQLEAILSVAAEIPGIREKVDKATQNLAGELTYNVGGVEKVIKTNQKAKITKS